MVSMREKITDAEFMRHYEAHLIWCGSSSSSGARLVLENTVFDGFTFSAQFNLAEAVFVDCSFNNCKFHDADLFAANFGSGVFDNCIFKNINLNKSLVDHATFSFCIFDKVTMIKSDLSKTIFIECKLNECFFNSAYMVRGKFEKCLVSENCQFEGADTELLQLVDTKLPIG